MNFKNLKIQKWQQFENVEIEFHERLTILTGANGSGKTTILNLLAKHFGWETQSLATPQKDSTSKIWKWITGLWNSESRDESQYNIGEIEYSDGSKSALTISQQNSAQYQIQIQNQQGVNCFFIPSHRSVFRYQHIDNIPTKNTIDKRQAFNKVSTSNKQRYFGGQDQSSSFHMKETLIAWNIFGQGNDDMDPSEKLLEYYRGFEEVLRIVLPIDLGFKKFVIRNFEVVLECESGDFIIDAASGGISAIIDMAWQVYMFSTDTEDKFTVIIDEIENHLHPTMQRRILDDFVRAFPTAIFIISTHSPLIVGSVENSEVYVLRHTEDKKIISQRLDLIGKAKSAAEILDEVLGVSFTMPIWAEKRLIEIVNKYSKSDLADKQLFENMRLELAAIGLEKLMPNAITNLIQKEDDKNQ